MNIQPNFIKKMYCGEPYHTLMQEDPLQATDYYADGKYHYYIRDYQGNNVAVVTRTNNVADVVSATLMYPFGGELTELHATDRYRFGGKEYDTMNGLNAYDFSARILDPVLCQFTSADPLAERYCSHSPYLYCAGNPVLFIDPTGEAKRHFYDRLGNYLHSEEYSGEEDAICIVEYKNGVLVLCRDENGKYMELFVGSGLFDILKHGRGYDVYRVLGDVNARNVFEFFANYVSKPYDIEYSLLITGRRPESSVNYITTSHLERMEGGVVSIYNQITNNIMISYIREFTHTHPNNSFSSESDRFFAGRIAVVQTSRYQHIPAFNIYYVPAGSYIPYMFSTK